MGSTVYLDRYQEVFFELRQSVTMSGATREAINLWLEDVQQVDTDSLEEAVDRVEESPVAVTDLVEQVDTVEEFIDHSKNEIHERQ